MNEHTVWLDMAMSKLEIDQLRRKPQQQVDS